MRIHPTAQIHPSLGLPDDVEVGPFALVDEDVTIGRGVRVGPFCHLYPGTRLGDNVSLSDGAVIGNKPQDLKYQGETTFVEIGAGTELREYVTVNRGTRATGRTRVGSNCLLMAYVHVAHDCDIGDRVVVANGVQMGGHVRIGDGAVISGMTGIHQFVAVGAGAFIGGALRVDKDVPPFSKALGDPLRWAGINEMGLARLGYGEAERKALKDFYRRLFELGVEAGLRSIGDGGEFAGLPEELKGFFRGRIRSLVARKNPETSIRESVLGSLGGDDGVGA
jgi:UDP-N-acetylglucosamine acyltransferase